MAPPFSPLSLISGSALPRGEGRGDDLREALHHSGVLSRASRIFVGFSGGIDSSVLLHALAQEEKYLNKIQAVHVNHQLQDAALEFEKFCKNFCENLKIKLIILNPQRKINSGESLEAYAREVRYECFKSCLEGPQDILVTAHHLEDQAETFLIQLFRGAGLPGLASMPVLNHLGAGNLYRPFLNISKQLIKNHAEFFKLNFIEDPSNLDLKLDRNFLRQEIFPRLKQRYGGLEKNIARSARHCASAQELLNTSAQELLKKIGGVLGKKLNLKFFWDLKKSEQILVLRFWLASFDLILSEAQIEILLNSKRLKIKNKNKFYDIREFKNIFYVLDLGQKPWSFEINQDHILNSLKIQGLDLEKLALRELIIKPRTQEEKIKYPGFSHHKCLKNIFQERDVPPWLREHIPLIYEGEKLIGIILPEVFE